MQMGKALQLRVPLWMQSLDYKNHERKEFWDALMVVAEAELKEARKQDEVDRARLRGMREPDQDVREDRSVQAAVDMDVQIFLTGEAHLTALLLHTSRQHMQLPCETSHQQLVTVGLVVPQGYRQLCILMSAQLPDFTSHDMADCLAFSWLYKSYKDLHLEQDP